MSSSEVVAVAKRRRFATAYIQRIVREADGCTAPGAIGALLRREGVKRQLVMPPAFLIDAGQRGLV